MTNQNLQWMRLDRATSITDDSELYRLLINFSTDGFALDLKVRMPAADIIGSLRDLAARMEHQLGLNQRAASEASVPKTAMRYEPNLDGRMHACEDGEWVKYEDIKHLLHAEPPAPLPVRHDHSATQYWVYKDDCQCGQCRYARKLMAEAQSENRS